MPGALVGRIVQILLDEYELGGPHVLIPPLRVNSFSPGTSRKYTPVKVIYFHGNPLRTFKILGAGESKFSQIRTLRFHGEPGSSQPHFLLYPELDVSNAYAEIVVYGSEADIDYLSRKGWPEESYFYVGSGLLQIFIPGKGYPNEWPSHFKWLGEVKKMTQELLGKQNVEVK